MEIDVIIWALEKLKSVSLHKAPSDIQGLGEPWFTEFREMPKDQFKQAINEIIKAESSWPTIPIVHKYASIGLKSKKRKNVCPYCEDTGFLLIRSKGTSTTYACKCKVGQKVWKNLKIASYESLGIPWPEPIEKPSFSKKMSKENKRLIDAFIGKTEKKIPEEKLIDTFIEKIGEEMPNKKLSEEALWEIMTDGSLCESG